MRTHLSRWPWCVLLGAALLLAACSVSVRPAGDPATATTAPAPVASLQAGATPTAPAAVTPSPTGTAPSDDSTASTATTAPTTPPATSPAPAAGTGKTPTPTPTPAPSPTPTATPAGIPVCAEEPVRGFGLAWHDDSTLARRIGCPLAPEAGVAGRVQHYEHGLMLWLDVQAPGIDSAPWVVSLSGGQATRQRVPSEGITWESDLVEPTGAFAWVWENVYTTPDQLGPATAPAIESDTAIQRFERGTMIWIRDAGGPRPLIYVVGSDLLTAASGPVQVIEDRSYP